MTRRSLALLLLTGATLHAGAQKIDPSRVPGIVKTSFVRQFPGVDKATWEKEGKAYEAAFKKDAQTMSALFTPEGLLTETEVDIPVSSLPGAIRDYVKTHYKGTIGEAARINKPNGEINYEAEVGGMDRIFDAGGKYLRSAKD